MEMLVVTMVIEPILIALYNYEYIMSLVLTRQLWYVFHLLIINCIDFTDSSILVCNHGDEINCHSLL